MSGLFDDIFGGIDGVANMVITLVGVDASYTRKTAVPYDPLSFNQGSAAPVVLPITCSPKVQYGVHEIDGVIIKKGDCKVFISSQFINFQIEPNSDTITLNGEVWTVINYSPFNTGTSDCAFAIQLRK